jgi:conjugal transfer pilus assembly protein TraF
MQKVTRIIALFSLAIFTHAQVAGGWLERKAEGWAWYEDMQKPEKKIRQENKPKLEETKPEELFLQVLPVSPAPLSAAERATKIRKDLEEKLAQAVLEPTEENVENYIREQQKWIDQSAHFSSTWAKVLLKQPELDATTEFPVSQYGIQLYKQLEQEKQAALMQKLNSHYGLFFFYEGKSKSSQAFSFVVQEFAKKYGWEVVAISKDGFLLEGFSDNHLDNGTIQTLGITVFPSLFLVNPQTADIRPISFGLVSLDRIERNIELQFSDLMEE